MTVTDWQTLKEIAKQGYTDGILCLGTVEIIKRSNRPALISSLNEADAGMAARILRDSALTRLHIFLCRAYAPCRKDDRHLRAAIEFLDQPGRIDEEPWPEKKADLLEAVRLFKEADVDPRLKGLKHMRDKLIAHLGVYDESIPRPLYNDLFGIARSTAQIWEKLSFGAGIVMIELDHQIDAYRESADAFWSRWETQP
ncbi:MAG: hypothetical protein ABJG86_11735 [Nitratireductor sp.]